MIFLKKLLVWQNYKPEIILGIFISLTFLLTWHGFFTGYERETWEAAESWINGVLSVRRAGPIAIILYLPFVLVARIIPSLNTERFFSLVPVVYSTLQVIILYFVAKKIFVSERLALIFSSLTALTSGIWVYTNAGMEYQSGFFLVLLLLLLLHWRDKAESAWLPSVGMALLIGTKAYMVSLGLPYILFLGFILNKQGQVKKFWSLKFLVSAGLIPALVIILDLMINWYLFGRLSGSYRFSGEFQIGQWWEGFYGLFFSAGKNIFLYAPLLIPTIWLWPKFYQREPVITIFVLVSLGILALVNLPFIYWTDETWGMRKFIPIVPLLHLPLLLFLSEWKSKNKGLKIFFTVITLLALYINFLGSTYTYGRQLSVLRATNLDSLTTLRYLPDWSHPRLFDQLWASYLHRTWQGSGGFKEYSESSWFRWVQTSGYDIILREANVDLKNFDQPSIIWLQPRQLNQKIGTGLFIVWLVSFFHLLLFIKKAK